MDGRGLGNGASHRGWEHKKFNFLEGKVSRVSKQGSVLYAI